MKIQHPVIRIFKSVRERSFILGLFVFSLLLWGTLHLLRSKNCDKIRITADGKEYGTYFLAEDQIIPIGDTNVCEIKNHKVYMLSADCPDQLCIRQGAIDASGGMIVCLPNKVVIEGIKEDAAADAVDSVS